MTRVDYDRLVAEYNAGLVETLRGFGPAADFLDLWVPDEDPLQGLANMLDAARAGGCPAIEIAIAAAVDPAALAVLAQGFGDAETSAGPDGLVLRVRFDSRQGKVLQRAAATVAAQRVATRALSPSPACGGGRGPAEGWEGGGSAAIPCEPPVRSPHPSPLPQAGEGATLSLSIDAGIIRGATIDGPVAGPLRGMLSALCQVVIGLPVQEAADHGVIRLERALRDADQPPPVPGVATPEAASPLFVTAQTLLRAAIADWRRQTGTPVVANDFDEGPRPAWLALDDTGRRRLLAEACDAFAQRRGGAPGDIEVVAIEYDVRVPVRLRGALAACDLMALERHIRRTVEPRLEIFLEPAEDANRIRRLSGQS